jgi:DNA-binding SARP family transcriptional activator
LEVTGGAVHVLERRDAALLAWLALEGPTPRERVMRLIWPECTTLRAANNNLRQRVFRLHNAIGQGVVAGGKALSLADGIAHDLDGVEQRLVDDPNAGAGDVLGVFDYDDCEELAIWMRAVRARWRATRRQALEDVVHRLESDGHIEAALRYAERLVVDEPTLESALRRLMRLHHLRGDRSAAIAAYERFRALLARDVGAAPEPQTCALLRKIETVSAPSAAPAPRLVTVLRPPRLVGRDVEWATIEAAVAAQHSVLVCGEAGIGKTRLLTDFATHHGQALSVGARADDVNDPYALIARLLRAARAGCKVPLAAWAQTELARLLPELGPMAAGRLEPLRLRQAIIHALTLSQAAGTQLIVADDLHYADAASIELLPALVSAEDTAELCWLLGARPSELPPALADWSSQAAGERIQTVVVRSLDGQGVRALLEALALPGVDASALGPALLQHTGGNPLFILETLRALLARGFAAVEVGVGQLPLPAGVSELIARRLQQLSEPAMALAHVAALAGQDFSAALAAQLLDRPAIDLAEPWNELEAADVLRGDAFAHDLVLEAAMSLTPEGLAQRLHRGIAEYLAAHGGRPARVAQHWYEASEWQRAGASYLQAADEALTASRRGDEAGLLGLAIECFERDGDRRRQFDCSYRCCEAAFHVEDMNRVKALVGSMLGLAEGDAEHALARVMEATESNVLFRAAEAEAAASKACALARRAGSKTLQLRATQQLANAWARLGRADSAIALMEPMLAELDHISDSPLRCSVLSDFAFLLEYADRRTEAIAWRDRLIALATADEDWSAVHVALGDQAISHYYLGHLEQSTAQFEQGRRLRERLGAGKGWSAMDDMGLAGNLRELGRYAEALALYDRASKALERGGFEVWTRVAESDRAVCFLQLGQTQRAMRLLSEPAPDASPFVRIYHYTTRARLERMRGASAHELLEKALELATAAGGHTYVRLKLETELCLELDPADGARRLESLVAESDRRQYLALKRMAMLYRADCLRRSGQVAEGALVARQVALSFADLAPAVIYAGDHWWITFQALDAGGDTPGADEALDRGARWINEAALPHVPAEFRDSFLDRNPTNRAILTTATRRSRRPC